MKTCFVRELSLELETNGTAPEIKSKFGRTPRDGFQVRRNFSSGHVSATSMKTIYGVVVETKIQILNGSTGRRLTSGGF
jgi:hypothetical protein